MDPDTQKPTRMQIQIFTGCLSAGFRRDVSEITVVIAGTMALGGGGFVFALICVLPTPVWQVRLMDVSTLHLDLVGCKAAIPQTTYITSQRNTESTCVISVHLPRMVTEFPS